MGRLISRNMVLNEDVYDIEVAESHRFVANNIVVHNCGK